MTPLVETSRRLSDAVGSIDVTTPAFVYNPLEYAREPHEAYLQRYGSRGAKYLLVGMNPGPFGMGQTGVPFGDVPSVRDWMGIVGTVGRPPEEHPKRPVVGFDLTRREGSGKRLWGWAQERFGAADTFFETFFVHNYCPLLFLHETGRNVTPDKLSAGERAAIFGPCDAALREVVEAIAPDRVFGVGRFAEDRANDALERLDVPISRILHPSPASPLANKDWPGQVERVFREVGVALPD